MGYQRLFESFFVSFMLTSFIMTINGATLTDRLSIEDDEGVADDDVGSYYDDGNADYGASHYNYGSNADYDDTTNSATGGSELFEDVVAVADTAIDGDEKSDPEYEAKSARLYDASIRSPKKKRVYVPVFVPERQKKKMKIIAVDKGFYIPGGTQLFGRFLSLKNCMKACGDSPSCFSADYNPWLKKCYQHSNFTACNTRKSHPQFIHFSKVPCTIIDAPAGKVTLGASMSGGILQKGLDTITECIKKCVSAGGGIQPTVSVGAVDASNAFARQACFAIDYDFSTHHCYFFGTNLWTVPFPTPATGLTQTYGQIFFHCPITVTGYQSLNTIPNPNVVHITFCPLPVG